MTERLAGDRARDSGQVRTAKKNYAKKVSIYELETTTTGQTMTRQEDAFMYTRTSNETLLVGHN